MPHIKKTALVAYSAKQMYDLVEAIESYPEFLPWCKKTIVKSRSDSEIIAGITMAVKGLEKSFHTQNPIVPGKSIEMHLLDGPFSQLDGRWEFQSLGETGCKVGLVMQFEISNPLLRATLGPLFNHIMGTLVDAFVKRAGEVYDQR
ncbi:type II toxin-antitoxin system RatA family toxin [Candidatus Venteria ishoeyi]|uniref:type II toxin-antitoxin system RatA family toxin n=1 Tax=Candidatus Venteria ishoeyi TaxID=1899563 RepID=UPI0025A5B39D|nr:type II toxin-antitoxin system RatA family toxin [Candidatus Venteria ishoeyi]MDM8547773.1 type II toxin-antitoxin system RatA family toxin [Candidatus Venteria ishoeyi]